MKSSTIGNNYLTVLLISICMTGTASAWNGALVPQTRQEFVRGTVAAAAATTFSAATAPPANAANERNVFNHSYSDPKHPNCRRIVMVRADGTANISGTDGTPGCPEDGSGTVWRLTGEVEGNTILVDFTPKGGPANLKGVWDGSGINWPDGNKWSVKD